MMYLKYLILLPFDILMKLIGLLFAPVVSLFVNEQGYLPDILYWFETPDSNMFGCLGDKEFYEENKDKLDTFLGRWWVCTKWQWRNTSQGFSTFCLGVIGFKDEIKTIWQSGEGDTVKYFKVLGENVAFEFKGAFQWFNLKKRFRWRIGWKLSQGEVLAQYVFSISPFTSMD